MPADHIAPGEAHPLGATWTGEGTNFAVAADAAEAVHLVLPGRDDRAELRELPLPGHTAGIFHGFVPGVGPGQPYGFRVHGPHAPAEGVRCNPAKFLLDPCARAISGPVRWSPAAVGTAPDGTPDSRDSAPHLPRALVVDPAFDWRGDRHPRTPWSRTVIYECHVKGMTHRHPAVPAAERGTYLGLASDPMLEYFTSLGITAVELLPVHHAADERHLVAAGLTNYWGYSTIGFFAPDARYASGADGRQVVEFKEMVRRLHAAGIEVLLDVVYNHTGEGGVAGGTYAFRGLDNRAYYRLDPADPAKYEDFTGTGNTCNAAMPRTRQLVLDSLRYWAGEMHVDGFRFDLAPALGRDAAGMFDPRAPLFEMIAQDPVLADCKLIAEPWDLGPGGYQLGHFPPGWSEWNGRYRDCVRRFWRGEGGQVPELASRLAGSSDLFEHAGRLPSASINFVTCHDGFTLQDLVSYERKHNEANGEDNRDGRDENVSRNWGAEGLSASVRVTHLRERVRRNFLATLLLSQGVPMLSHGDERGRTQHGNNNAYCQDNAISWVDWGDDSRDLTSFVRDLLAVRRANAVFRRRHFVHRQHPAGRRPELEWFTPEGAAMTDADWADSGRHALQMLLRAHESDELDEDGGHAPAATVLLVLNGGGRRADVVLPAAEPAGGWRLTLSTAPLEAARRVALPPHSLALFTWDAAATP